MLNGCSLARFEGNLQRPDVFGLEGYFLTNDLSLVAGLAMNGGFIGFHDGLPSSGGTKTMRLLDAVVHE